MGLTDHQQSLVLLVSAMLIAIAAVDPADIGLWGRLVLSIMGAVGFALKEWTGGKPS